MVDIPSDNRHRRTAKHHLLYRTYHEEAKRQYRTASKLVVDTASRQHRWTTSLLRHRGEEVDFSLRGVVDGVGRWGSRVLSSLVAPLVCVVSVCTCSQDALGCVFVVNVSTRR